jgi:hypothetical protein
MSAIRGPKVMNRFTRLLTVTLFTLAVLASRTTTAATHGQLLLPNFDALAQKASKSVSITLDSNLLQLAVRFLDPADPQDSAAKAAIAGLKGIYVKSYTFDEEFAYPQADLDRVRRQLSSPGWQRLVEVRSRKNQANVDIYIAVDQGKATGLAIIASEAREFTVVNIVGSIDLHKLHQLEGQFGIPKLQLDEAGTKAK